MVTLRDDKPLAVCLLGQPQFFHFGRPFRFAASRRALALTCYLILKRRAPVSRGAVTLAHKATLENAHIGLRQLVRVLAQQSANAGFADSILALAPLACLGVLIAILLKRTKTTTPVVVLAAE